MSKKYPKSVTPVDEYVCTLPEVTKKLAEEELRETDSSRKQALEALREWADQNPRIKAIRLDSNFLLRFLRCKKYSLSMAKEQIERYMVLRHFEYENRKLFINFDYTSPVMTELIDLGVCFPLPQRDHLNRRIIFYRPGLFNPSKHHNYELIQFGGIIMETLMEDESVQVHGLVHVVDSTGVGLNYLTLFTPQQAYRLGRHFEKIVPIRQKQVHGLKSLPSIKFAVDFALSQMSSKMRNRIFLYKDMKDMKIDRSLFPLEYGGTIPMKDMIESFKKELAARRETILGNDKMDVNLEMYPDEVRYGSVRSLKKTIDEVSAEGKKSGEYTDYDNFAGLQGSFRKLEID